MNYRKVWEEVNGPIPIDDKGRKYEIHHVDGNHNNNDINNLICISIEEHYDIHLKQGDFTAANLIADRIKNPKMIVKGFKRPHSEEAKSNMRKPKSRKENYRKPKSPEHIEAIRKARIGTTRSEETRLLLSKQRTGKTPKVNLIYQTCLYCGKQAKGFGYTRWHGDNCKHKQ